MCAHTLNLIVQGATATDVNLSALKTQCNTIVAYFHRSVKASDRLVNIQKRLNIPQNKLIQEVETRLNSICNMFQKINSYIERHNAITTTLC